MWSQSSFYFFSFICKLPRHSSVFSLLAVTSLIHWKNSRQQRRISTSSHHLSSHLPILVLNILSLLAHYQKWTVGVPTESQTLHCVLDSIPSSQLRSLLKCYYQWVLHWQPSLKFCSLWYFLFLSHDSFIFSISFATISHSIYCDYLLYVLPLCNGSSMGSGELVCFIHWCLPVSRRVPRA